MERTEGYDKGILDPSLWEDDLQSRRFPEFRGVINGTLFV